MTRFATHRPYFLAICALAGLFHPAICNLQSAISQEVEWRKDYDQARREAAEKNRPLVLDFGYDGCVWCQKQDATTFRDPAVAALLNERFVPLKIDINETPSLAQTLRLQSYPTVVMAAADGKILAQVEGYQTAPQMIGHLQRVLALVTVPEWMARDFDAASRAIAAADYARAIALLKHVVDDGKRRPIQVKAQNLLDDLEDQASGRLARARQLMDKGQLAEAMETTTELLRVFAGTQAARDGARILTAASSREEMKTKHRQQRAKELLALAREDFRTREYLCCLNRCNLLLASFADLPEGLEASQLAGEIKSNPEWLQTACDSLSEQLGGMYLALAESWLKKGQPQQATIYLERVVQSFPNSPQADAAQVRLAQIQGQPTRPVDFKKP